MITWHSYPTVSVLMTHSNPARREMALGAIECFNAQKWPLKDLVIINCSGEPFKLRHGRDILVSPKPEWELKNLAIECALGEWCLLWDSTCWFDPDYISKHMRQADRLTVTVTDRVSLCDRQGKLGESECLGLSCFFRLASPRFEAGTSNTAFAEKFNASRKIDASEHVLKFVDGL